MDEQDRQAPREQEPRGQTPPEGRRRAAPTRRTVVAGTGLLAVVAAATACGGNQKSAAPPAAAPPPAPGAQPPAGAAPQRLGSASAIPVGGGQVFRDSKVVVTQPTAGNYRGFSAVCTHEGCTVNKIAAGTIDCPCHGSKFAVTDGAPVHGPAKAPLPPRPVSVQEGMIVLG